MDGLRRATSGRCVVQPAFQGTLADDQFEDNGTLTIIDRIKHLVSITWLVDTPTRVDGQVKLQNGEYIALDKVESVYKACGQSTRLAQLVCAQLMSRCDHDALLGCSQRRRQSDCHRLSCM